MAENMQAPNILKRKLPTMAVVAIGGIAVVPAVNATSASKRDTITHLEATANKNDGLKVGEDVFSLSKIKEDLFHARLEKVEKVKRKQANSEHSNSTLQHINQIVDMKPSVIPGDNASEAFTPTWWRCVINPESSGNFNDTSGGYGILVSTWHAYGMNGSPGDYPPSIQEKIALRIYHDNGGFGPEAWNNSANCGKGG